MGNSRLHRQIRSSDVSNPNIPQILTRWGSKVEKRISLRAKLGPAVLLFLFVSAIYLYAFPQANLVYPAVVLAHAGLGLLAAIGILWQVLRSLKRRDWLAATAWLVLGVGAMHRRGTDLYWARRVRNYGCCTYIFSRRWRAAFCCWRCG